MISAAIIAYASVAYWLFWIAARKIAERKAAEIANREAKPFNPVMRQTG